MKHSCIVVNSQGVACKNMATSHDICATHQYRLMRFGDVRADTPIRAYSKRAKVEQVAYKGDSDEGRFWSRVKVTMGCWEWSGSAARGTPQMHWKGWTRPTRHVAWEVMTGAAPAEGVRVRNTCGDKQCVRPSHTDYYPEWAAMPLPVAA